MDSSGILNAGNERANEDKQLLTMLFIVKKNVNSENFNQRTFQKTTTCKTRAAIYSNTDPEHNLLIARKYGEF